MSYDEKIQLYVEIILIKAIDNVIPLSCAVSAISYIKKIKKYKTCKINEEVNNV